MQRLTIEGAGSFEVEEGKRLVLALTDDAGGDQLHACGEPEKMTAAEKSVLEARQVTGVRLSCQIPCDQDMTVRIVSRLEGSGRPDPGSRPDDQMQPQPVKWVDKT